MSLTVDDHGTGNTISLPNEGDHALNGQLILNGNNNHIEIGSGCLSNSIYVALGSNCDIRIGSSCNLGNLFVHAEHDARLGIGSGCGFNGLVRILLHEAREIQVGSGCLVAGDVDVTVSDMHSIVDAITGERINPARDIMIEERVWIGQRSMILKGARIGMGSIIGACSLVSGEIPPNCIAAGAPARVRRSGVTWRHDLI